MLTIGELRASAAAHLAHGDTVPALRLYDAIVTAAPLDFAARMKVADCLLALGAADAAADVYRAVGFYCIRAGHPLSALVAARVVKESLGGQADDLVASLIAHYGSESEVTGAFAARIPIPDDSVQVAGLGPVTEDLLRQAAARATHATDGYQAFPAVLHPIPLLSEMSEEALRRVLATLVVRRLPGQSLVIREGEPGQSFYFLAAGEVSVFDLDSMGATRSLARLGEGAIFGEMALLSAKPRSASVATVGEADLLEATRESLAALADELPAVATALQKFTYERMLQNLMARNPLFRPFTRSQQRDLLRRFTSHDVAPGTDIIHEGDPGTGLFVVLSGAVEVKKESADSTTPLATLRAGDVFGEMSLLRSGPTTATVTASEQSTVLFLSRDYVERMVANIPAVRDYLSALADDRELDTKLAMQSDDDDDSIVILF